MLEALLPTAYGFALLLFRTGGLVATAPLFSLKSAPLEVKLGLCVAVSMAIFTGAGSPSAVLPAHLGALCADVLLETTLGLLAGLGGTVMLEAAAAAGQLAAQAMGLSYGAVVDPVNGIESTTIGELMRLLGLSTAIALGVHHEAILWLASSVRAVPPGTVGSVTEMARGSILQSLNAMALAIRLGFPFLAATTLGHAVLGALGRAAPQMHFSNLGFSVSILFGGGALWLATPPMLKLAAEATLSAFSAR